MDSEIQKQDGAQEAERSSLHEVLACPFCGSAAQVRPREDYYDFRVFCTDDKCGCASPRQGHTWEQAVEWWNRRQANEKGQR